MNLYIVVEGKSGERKVYPEWMKCVNSNLTQVISISELKNNNYYLISGNGYPHYFKIIDSAIEDLNNNHNIDVLVIAVDSEDLSYEEKKKELTDYIHDKIDINKVRLIIQHPCLEVWALGNKIVCRRNPKDSDLRRYLKIFDVRNNDPELIPSLEPEGLNRCQFAFKYLKKMLCDRYPKLVYTKHNPEVIVHKKYFEQIKKRLEDDKHIMSFSTFIKTFKH